MVEDGAVRANPRPLVNLTSRENGTGRPIQINQEQRRAALVATYSGHRSMGRDETERSRVDPPLAIRRHIVEANNSIGAVVLQQNHGLRRVRDL